MPREVVMFCERPAPNTTMASERKRYVAQGGDSRCDQLVAATGLGFRVAPLDFSLFLVPGAQVSKGSEFICCVCD